MPIYLDRDLYSHNPAAGTAANCIEIGVINNMPDGALKTTEHLFIRLLDSVADRVAVRLMFYALPEVPRGETARHHIASFYSSIDSLWHRRLDGLIMTGCEPRASNLRDEPYWASMTRVIDWAEGNTASAIWSCLAAHAAALHRDGIARRQLANKRCGVFECVRVENHPLTDGLSSPIVMPHSRWNDLAEDQLTASGYRILTRAASAGVDAFVKPGKSLSIFFQGHPEYEATTLLHEYNRDLKRYRNGETDVKPELPEGCLGKDDPWRFAAKQIYRNWLAYLSAQKDEARKKDPEREGVLHKAAAAG